jgi:hypothetical protein
MFIDFWIVLKTSEHENDRSGSSNNEMLLHAYILRQKIEMNANEQRWSGFRENWEVFERIQWWKFYRKSLC